MIRYLVHFSNILLLVAYSVRDILWLRCFAIAAALSIVPYFIFHTKVWAPVVWAAVFTTINAVQVVRILRGRRPVVLRDDEQRLYELTFAGRVRPREFVPLLLVGQWKNAVPGDRLLIEGRPVHRVCIAVSGSIEVRKRDTHLGVLEPGHVVGSALAVTGSRSPVDATFTEPGRYICWSLATLELFLDRRPVLRDAMQDLVNRDLANKVGRLVEHEAIGPRDQRVPAQ